VRANHTPALKLCLVLGVCLLGLALKSSGIALSGLAGGVARLVHDHMERRLLGRSNADVPCREVCCESVVLVGVSCVRIASLTGLAMKRGMPSTTHRTGAWHVGKVLRDD
jgi:hypothetical protein